jgi:hypothetical protein
MEAKTFHYKYAAVVTFLQVVGVLFAYFAKNYTAVIGVFLLTGFILVVLNAQFRQRFGNLRYVVLKGSQGLVQRLFWVGWAGLLLPILLLRNIDRVDFSILHLFSIAWALTGVVIAFWLIVESSNG